ncbi:MAG TPA: dTDP-4-dehydrorhamnose 3,5-epimerase [Dermatophilaceae bacterium]|jgi:dTDP-4-dehydrorhamnose 3,5-epimerase
MIFTPTTLTGAAIIDLDRREDDRGFFARTFCRKEFAAAGLEPLVEQCNVSFNHVAGTLRGMHYQVAPALEAKLIRCIRGAVVDIIVDMRPESGTYLRHIAVELNRENRRMLYVPPLFAHGYQTLTDGTEVTYQVSETYTPSAEAGLRYDDPALGLCWPMPVTVISPKDAAWPLLAERTEAIK